MFFIINIEINLKPKKTLSNRLTNRYLLIIRNEENFAEKTTFSFTYAKLVVFFLTTFIILFIISLYLVNTILAQWFDPRHAEMEANRKLITLSLAVDSLAEEVRKKDLFIDNFQAIVNGEDPGKINKKRKEQETAAIEKLNDDIDLQNLPDVDSQFRKEFEQPGGVQIVLSKQMSGPLQEIFFFSPITGIITSPFNMKSGHYGVDVVSKRNEPVKSVADGTVIFSDWSQEAGNVIAIQHKNNLISVYKHNSALMKEVGDFVDAGDIVSIIGNTGELTTGPHLHFELWYNGNPMDPEEFVSF